MRKRLKHVAYAVLGCCVLFVLLWEMGPTSADIRLDTGDLRYRYFGVPVVYERMSEPHRSRLLELAGKVELMESRWVRLDGYPPQTSNNVDAMCWSMYAKLSAWAVEDEQIAIDLGEDLVGWLHETGAGHGLPDNGVMLRLAEFDQHLGEFRAIEDWRHHEDAAYYLGQ